MKYAKKRAQLLGATKNLLATLAQTAPEQELLRASIEGLMELIQVKYGAITILDDHGNLSQFVHAGLTDEQARHGMSPPRGTGLLGVVIQQNLILRLDDMTKDPRSQGFPPGHPAMTSLLAVPISNLDRVYGRIYLCDKFDKNPFSDEDQELAISFANAISLLLDNARKLNQLEKSQHQLLHTAFHDALTGLPNRVLLSDRISQALCHANRNQTQLAVLFCDLDGFKTVNDTFGHRAGDHVLKTMGERFVNCVRGDDTVARFGGDEFVFVLPEVESVEHTRTVAQKILDTISQLIHIDGHDLVLCGSIGIALYPLDGEETESLVKNADLAMYKAKKQGKNNYQFFEEKLLAECPPQSAAHKRNYGMDAATTSAATH
ncbi:MAG: sensor domain-containing diguanylate cyclase [Nitrosomonadales bacterium]|nr:sensor domain-containing diguanylate cyclase [Nitrosomonadales bacterium]